MDAALRVRTIKSMHELLRQSNYRLTDMQHRLRTCAKRYREGLKLAISIAKRQRGDAEAVLAEIEALS